MSDIVTSRLSKVEKIKLRSLAKSNKLSISDFIRKLINEYDDESDNNPTEDNTSLITSLGNNLNVKLKDIDSRLATLEENISLTNTNTILLARAIILTNPDKISDLKVIFKNPKVWEVFNGK